MENILLTANAMLSGYNRNALIPRIVHLGFGAFHCAHQAVYADTPASEYGSDWGYTEVSLIGGEQQVADLRQQDRPCTVAEVFADAWTIRVVGVVKQVLHVQVDDLEAMLVAMCEPQIAIVPLTIIEKGYCHSPAGGELQFGHSLIVADLHNLHQPKSASGVVVEAPACRRAASLPAFIVMSCDNMPENGHVTRNVVCAYARALDTGLAAWIEQNVTLPPTMVDRIAPAVTAETLDRIERLTGMRDPAGVAYELFCQWVVEDNFAAGRPQWERAGAELVADAVPSEEMKLRMLNSSHSLLVHLGYLAGYQHINDCMQDDNYRRAALALMLDEQAPMLKVQGADSPCYVSLLINRYCNPASRHRTWQIAMDGSQKLPQRMLDSVRWYPAHRQNSTLLTLGAAGRVRYVSGVDDAGQAIEICDPLLPVVQQAVAASVEGEARVKALLGIEAIFGLVSPQEPRLVSAVIRAYLASQRPGVKATVAAWAAER